MRKLQKVIDAIVAQVPATEKTLLTELENAKRNADFSSPETMQGEWSRVSLILNSRVGEPGDVEWKRRVREIWAGSRVYTSLDVQLYSRDTLHVRLPDSLNADEFETAMAGYSYNQEEADIQQGFTVSAESLKRATEEAGAGEPIPIVVYDFLQTVLGLPIEADDYFFYVEKKAEETRDETHSNN